jgi:hypothetical protein
MADGGIAGYPDDDFVTRNQSVVMMAGGGIARFAGEGPSLVRGDFFSQLDQQKASQLEQLNGQLAIIEPQLRAATSAGDQQAIQMYSQQAQGIRNQINAVRESAGNRLGAIEGSSAPSAAPPARATPAMPTGQFNRMAGAERVALPNTTTGQGARQQAEFIRQQDKLMKGRAPRRQGDEFEAEEKMASDRAANPPVVAPAAAPARKDGPARKDPSARPAAGPSTTGQFDVESMMNAALAKAEAKPDPYEARQTAINAAKIKAEEENVSGLEAINKQFADIFKGRKERLDTREGEIGKMKDQSLGLALLNAGAAMMQTRGSVGQAAGAGIDKFSQQYVAGLDKINSAKDKLNEARDRLEEIESQRGELSAREMHKARNQVKATTIAGMEDLVKAAMAERKMNRTEAIAFVNAQLQANLKMYEVDQRSKDTRALIAARGDTSEIKQSRLQLDSLKAQAANISKELADPMLGLPRNAPLKQAKQAELARINAQMNQIAGLSTIAPASPTGAGGGVKFLGYE